MVLRRLTTGDVKPVSVDEIKLALRIDGTAIEDDLLDIFIASAADFVADLTWTSVTRDRWELALECFPSGAGPRPDLDAEREIRTASPAARLHLPRGPNIEIQEIRYYDADGTLQTIDVDTACQTSAADDDFIIAPAPGTAWPETQPGRLEAVVIQWDAGHDGDPLTFPPQIKQAVLMVAIDMYENRGDGIDRWNCSAALEARVKQLCRNLSWFRFDIGRTHG